MDQQAHHPTVKESPYKGIRLCLFKARRCGGVKCFIYTSPGEATQKNLHSSQGFEYRTAVSVSKLSTESMGAGPIPYITTGLHGPHTIKDSMNHMIPQDSINQLLPQDFLDYVSPQYSGDHILYYHSSHGPHDFIDHITPQDSMNHMVPQDSMDHMTSLST